MHSKELTNFKSVHPYDGCTGRVTATSKGQVSKIVLTVISKDGVDPFENALITVKALNGKAAGYVCVIGLGNQGHAINSRSPLNILSHESRHLYQKKGDNRYCDDVTLRNYYGRTVNLQKFNQFYEHTLDVWSPDHNNATLQFHVRLKSYPESTRQERSEIVQYERRIEYYQSKLYQLVEENKQIREEAGLGPRPTDKGVITIFDGFSQEIKKREYVSRPPFRYLERVNSVSTSMADILLEHGYTIPGGTRSGIDHTAIINMYNAWCTDDWDGH